MGRSALNTAIQSPTNARPVFLFPAAWVLIDHLTKMSDLRSTDNAADNQYRYVIVAECTDSRALCIDNNHIGCCVSVQVQGSQIRQ